MAPFQFIERAFPFKVDPGTSLPVFAVTADIENSGLAPAFHAWAKHTGYKAEAGSLLLVPNESGRLAGALFGLGKNPSDTPFISGRLARSLPEGNWRIETDALTTDQLLLGYGLGGYRFERYKKEANSQPVLTLSKETDVARLQRLLAGVFLARDLINTPTNDMGPDNLEQVFRGLAAHYQAEVSVISGDDLLTQNFPLIHAVGRASEQAPRLLKMRWGKKGDRKITLVGKGVTFDTGGLDIKPSASMLLMKKDMGGAANVMGLALMIMDAGLKVDLTVLVPVVENSISGNAFRPGDIYRSRAGMTVQIDNTDAEGRLILADALDLADEDAPDLLIDMATLTGAARVALGPDLPPFFTDDETLAASLAAASLKADDPLWRLPLYKGYEKDLNTKIADITNAPSGGMAGAITAALFLKRFVKKAKSWAHFDIFGWNPTERPHAPVGGEAQAIRAIFHMLEQQGTGRINPVAGRGLHGAVIFGK